MELCPLCDVGWAPRAGKQNKAWRVTSGHRLRISRATGAGSNWLAEGSRTAAARVPPSAWAGLADAAWSLRTIDGTRGSRLASTAPIGNASPRLGR